MSLSWGKVRGKQSSKAKLLFQGDVVIQAEEPRRMIAFLRVLEKEPAILNVLLLSLSVSICTAVSSCGCLPLYCVVKKVFHFLARP